MVSLRRTETVSLSGSLVEKVATTEPMALPAASSVKLLVLISVSAGASLAAAKRTVLEAAVVVVPSETE